MSCVQLGIPKYRLFIFILLLCENSWSTGIFEPIPEQHQFDAVLVELGKQIFSEKKLSPKNISCNSCHDLQNYGVSKSEKEKNNAHKRDVLSVYNASLNVFYFWDGRFRRLENALEYHLKQSDIMAISWPQTIESLKNIESFDYEKNYRKLYPATGLTADNIIHSLSLFIKKLNTPDSDFDRFLKGDTKAMSEAAQQGYKIFKQVGCAGCHNGIVMGANLFQKNNVFFPSKLAVHQQGKLIDYGRYQITHRIRDKFVFRVPGLRNVVKTAPYLHDGSIDSLYQTLSYMTILQSGRVLSDEQIKALIAFLNSLTGRIKQ